MRLGNKIKCLELGKVLGTLDDLLLDLEDVEADGLGERAALTNGDGVTLLDTNEGRGHVGGQVLFCVEILRSPQSVSFSLMPLFVLDTREIIELGQRTKHKAVSNCSCKKSTPVDPLPSSPDFSPKFQKHNKKLWLLTLWRFS